MSFLQYFNWSYWLIPSYAPAYGQLGNYGIWGQSILMYFFLICTAVTLAIITLMDNDSPNISASSSSSSSSSTMNPPSELEQGSELGPPVPPTGGKKSKHKNKSNKRRK